MQSDSAYEFANEEGRADPRLKLGANEQLLDIVRTMQPWQAVLWAALLFSSGGSLLVVAIAIAYLVPGGEGLGLYDRVLRLVLRVNTAVFGPHLAHLTTERLVIEMPGQPLTVLSLRHLSGTETRSFRLGGNLFVHLGGPGGRRAGLWVVQPRELAARIHRACREVR